MKFPMKYCILGCQEDDDGGRFSIPFEGRNLHVIASNGGGWNHVSVSLTAIISCQPCEAKELLKKIEEDNENN